MTQENTGNQSQTQTGINVDHSENITFNQTQIIQISPETIKTRPFSTISPYKGLEAFQLEDKEYFFGRDQFLRKLAKDLEETSLILLLGKSGSGKSSLVRAGLIPWLLKEKGSHFVYLTLKPDQDPFESLRSSLVNKEVCDQSQAKIALEAQADTLSKVVKLLQKKDKFWFIFIDQFEELFTTTQKEKRDSFIASLVQLAKANLPRVKIMATMQASFFEELSSYSALVKVTEKHRPLMTEMDENELRMAIEQPAAHRGVVFEDGLVKKIIQDVQGQAGYLPLLQYTLNLLWKKEVDTEDIDDRTLNMDTYHELEGVKGALQKHVDEIYKALSKEEQEAAKRIFLKLVGIAGNPDSGIEWKPVRKRARLSEFSNEETTVLNKLINEKLLVSDRNSEKDESTVEIAHEILLTSWDLLKRWITDNRQNIDWRNRLNYDVKLWETDSKAETELWDGSKLLKVQELRKDENFKDVLGGFDESANQFIDASAKLRDRKLRRTIIGLASFSGVMLILAGFAGWQWWQAVAAKTDALVRSSDALFSLGKKHDALIESLRVPSKNNPALVTVLQQAVDGINTNRLSGNTEAVRSVAFSSDGKVFASGSDDNTIKIWDFATRKVITTLTGHNRPVLGVSFSPDGKTLFSCSADSTIKFWDVATGKEITTLTGHKDAIRSISVNSDGKILASGSDDKTIKLWDVSKRKEIKTLTAHQKTVNSVSFSPDGKILASGSEDGTIKFWNVDTGKETATIFESKDKEADSVQSVSFSPDGKILAYGQGSSIKLWDVATKKEIRTLQDSLTGFAVWSVKFSPDGKTLASGDLDSQVKLWDVAQGKINSTLMGHSGGVLSVEFSPDGTTLATGSADKTIILWGGPRVNNPDFSEHIGLFNSLSYSPDGKILAYGIEDGKIKLLDVATGNDIDILTGHTGGIYSISFSRDGKIMASGSSDKTIKIWDIAKKKEIRTLKGHNDAIRSLSFSHDGKTVASGSDDKTIKLWDINTGKYSTLFTDKDTVHSISFSPDGKILASNSNSSSIKLWDVTTRKEIEIPNIGEYQSSVSNVLFSPDSKTIAFSSKDNTIKLLNLKTNKVISLKGHAAFVLSLSFSPDGKILASGSTDKTIKLWDIATGKELTTLKQYNGAVTSVIFSPDGKTLASADSFSDGKVIIRSLELDKLLVRGCHLVRDYLENNPDLSETDKHLCDGVERYWLAEGEELAAKGDVEGAIAKFKKAKEKDSNLTFDPQKKAKEIAVQALLQQVSLLIKRGQLEQAKIAYAKAQKLAPKDISAPDWNNLCWNGSLLGYAGDNHVKDACENAVKLDPKDGTYRDSRGFAKALSRDKSGAINDFQAYLDWINNPQVRKTLAKSKLEAYKKLIPKRQRWIAALREGNDPFTTNELKMIRKEEF